MDARLAALFRSLNRAAPYTMEELHQALREIRRANPDEGAFTALDNKGIDLAVYLARAGWIKRVGNREYIARVPDDGRRLSLPPSPPYF